MRNLLRTYGGLAVALGLVLMLGCENGTEPGNGNGNGGGETPATAVQVTVTTDGSAAQGVTVELFAAGSQTAAATGATGSGGQVTFDELSAGQYEVEVEIPEGQVLGEGETKRKAVTVVTEETALVTFALVSEDASGEVVEVHLTSGLQFEGGTVTISTGTTVRWVNDANMFHTITPDDHSEWARTTVSNSGETFSHVFTSTGTFPYFCEPHESAGMTGTITVQ